MKNFFASALLAGMLLAASSAAAKETPETEPNIHYKKAKDIDFEELLIQGRLKRPEMSVVTGDIRDTTDGLLRLRENFWDRMARDNGEEQP